MAFNLKLKLVLITLLAFCSTNLFAQNQSLSKDRLVGSILKNALETYHYTKNKINDDISDKAFEEFLKKIDYGKQFLLQKDVKDLEKYHLTNFSFL